MTASYCTHHSKDYRDNHEDNNEKDEHLSRSLIHGIQPSDHDDLHNVSQCNITGTAAVAHHPAMY
jgi:hypothetical protein